MERWNWRQCVRRDGDRRAAAKVVGEYALITLGAFLVALGADVFLIPNKVVSGG